MPNIAQFDNPITGLQPTEIGVHSRFQEGLHVGAFYKQIGGELGSAIAQTGNAAVQYVAHREISHGAAAYAGLFDDLTQQWNEAAKSADPNDPTTAATFREKVLEPTLDKFRTGFLTEHGQQWADSRTDHLRQHFFQKTAADMSTLAGDALHVNVHQLGTRLSNSVYLDPSGLAAAHDVIDASVEAMVGSSPNLKGADAAKLRTELADKLKDQVTKSAAVGAVRRNPEAGLALAQDPLYAKYLSGADLDKLTQEARSVQRAERVDRAYAEHLDKIKKQQDSDAAVVDIRSRLDGGENIAAKDIWTNNTLLRHDKEHLVTIMDQKARGDLAKDDPQLKDGLINRFLDPSASMPTKSEVLAAEAQGKLSPKTGAIFRQWIEADQKGDTRDEVFKETMHAARQLIGTDPVGAGKYASFVQEFLPRYRALQREGKLPENALDLKDENSLIAKSMQQYRRPITQIMMDRAARGDFGIGAGALTPQPQKPGATPAVPDPLKGIAALAWSPSKQQWYDQTEGKAYDRSGKEITR